MMGVTRGAERSFPRRHKTGLERTHKEARFTNQDSPDPQFDAMTARLLRREAWRRAAEEVNTTSGQGSTACWRGSRRK